MLLNVCVCLCPRMCVGMCETEQLESFKRHMEAGEMSVQAGEDENEEDVENGQLLHNTALIYC